MLLTITYTGQNATDLSYLLYKNPNRPRAVQLSFGTAYVFYPEVSEERTTAALLLDIDPIDLAKGKPGEKGGGLFDYVNDRPYVTSSFMSTAISKVFGTAMSGRADSLQWLSDSAIDLSAAITMLPCRGDTSNLSRVFEPLGYKVEYEPFMADENFPSWGLSNYVNLTISGKTRLRDLLSHLYVLIPVFDRQKHYWVGESEVDKLLSHSEEWLPSHPAKAFITKRYLSRSRKLANIAFERLAEMSAEMMEPEDEGVASEPSIEETIEKSQSLNDKRLGAVLAELKSAGAKRVIDLGCGEGNLIRLLLKEKQFEFIAGMDASTSVLGRAEERLKLENAAQSKSDRVKLFQGSLVYQDSRISGYDAACVVEVIEHLDAPRIAAFERSLFEFARPPIVIITTPNIEYNALYKGLSEGGLRHNDHRFEWTRAEFQGWAAKTASRYGYTARFSDIGDSDTNLGSPTQMGVFTLCE